MKLHLKGQWHLYTDYVCVSEMRFNLGLLQGIRMKGGLEGGVFLVIFTPEMQRTGEATN